MEVYWSQQCKQLEEDSKRGHIRNIFIQVRKIQTQFCSRKGTIRGKDGNILISKQDIKNRWREYTEQLYSRNDTITA